MYRDLQLQSYSALGDFFSCFVIGCSLVEKHKVFQSNSIPRICKTLFPSVCIDNFAAYALVKEQTETEVRNKFPLPSYLKMQPFPGSSWQQIHIKCRQ